MARMTTLLDLVNAVNEYARSDAELIATVVYMVNGGHVGLCGTFKGSRFDLASLSPPESGRENGHVSRSRDTLPVNAPDLVPGWIPACPRPSAKVLG